MLSSYVKVNALGLVLSGSLYWSYLATKGKSSLIERSSYSYPSSNLHRRQDDSVDMDPLSIDLSSNDPAVIQAAYVPQPLPSDAVSALQQSSANSIQDVDTGILADPTGATSGSPDPSLADTSTYTQIPDLTGQYMLYAAPDGNFHPVPAGSQGGGLNFVYDSNTAATDDGNRLMFYYPDTMQKYGVSRFRINDQNHIPIGTQAISLISTYLGNGDPRPTFLAADTSGNVFSMLTCTYSDGVTPSKIFLANDAYAGAQQLKSPSMQSIVTGAPINDCHYIQFVDMN